MGCNAMNLHRTSWKERVPGRKALLHSSRMRVLWLGWCRAVSLLLSTVVGEIGLLLPTKGNATALGD